MAELSNKRRRAGTRPRVKKLRVAFVVLGLSVLAFVSWIFGIMMAVAQDLPQLEQDEEYRRAQNSVVYDIEGREIATLTGNERRILLSSEEISPIVKQAVIAIEDRRFYEHRGIDYIAIARALREDILSGSAVQGASTITQQFVKNALEAQTDRTVLQKLREAALAYHLEREWSKDKILTNYLNNIYFGEGAYGIEAAARTYFRAAHPGCGAVGERCASQLRPEEAAMLAAMISSPSAYSPRANPVDAKAQRDIVLQRMVEEGYLQPEQYDVAIETSIPAPSEIEPPTEESAAPYFTDWLRQQLVDKYGAGAAFGGGLQVTSSLDLDMQEAAEASVSSRVGVLGPSAAVVVIDNATGQVRAMVGGMDFSRRPFNLATNGRRQPGSAFKPFTLIAALERGVSPDTVYSSQQKNLPFTSPHTGKREIFEVHNYNDSYLGSASVSTATTYSDNSVYAELGLDIGVENVVDAAERMGIDSSLSTNPAVILGGLNRGVTPLEMAYAYTTLANGGQKVSGSMASKGVDKGPVGIARVETPSGDLAEDQLGASGKSEVSESQVIPPGVADSAINILNTVVTSGTGRRANIGEFAWGKTGTTDSNIDAWFVGSTEYATAAVWVGYADGSTPMETEFGGAPVDGGTIPALIWNDVMTAIVQIYQTNIAEQDAEEAAEDAEEAAEDAEGIPTTPQTELPAEPPAEPEPVPDEQAPVEEEPAPAPEATEAAPPASGTEEAVGGGVSPDG